MLIPQFKWLYNSWWTSMMPEVDEKDYAGKLKPFQHLMLPQVKDFLDGLYLIILQPEDLTKYLNEIFRRLL